MIAIRAQFVFAFAVMGCLLPYLSVYLEKQQGLGRDQIGLINSTQGIAILLSPIIITALADTRFDARRLMMGIFLLSAGATLLAANVEGFLWVFVAMAMHSLVFVPVLNLEDAIHFGYQERRRSASLPVVPYHRIRVWGTIGFIVPSAVLYVLMNPDFGLGLTTRAALFAAAMFAIAGAINTRMLPDPKLRQRPAQQVAPDARRLPTFRALSALLHRPVLVFCIAMFLAQVSQAAFYGFFPIYLSELGVADQWLGPITSIGVVVEIGYMLAFGFLLRKFGLKWLMVLGIGTIVLRSLLLAAWPAVGVAVALMLVHGLAVIISHVAPQVYVNSRAGPGFRGSMQGLYTMLVMGAGRLVGAPLAGVIAGENLADLRTLFACAAGLSLVAAMLFIFAFHDTAPSAAADKSEAPGVDDEVDEGSSTADT